MFRKEVFGIALCFILVFSTFGVYAQDNSGSGSQNSNGEEDLLDEDDLTVFEGLNALDVLTQEPDGKSRNTTIIELLLEEEYLDLLDNVYQKTADELNATKKLNKND